jgi:hypothetical protein
MKIEQSWRLTFLRFGNKMNRILAALILSCASVSAAVNGTTPASLNLLPTFHCISVEAPYTGDEDLDNSSTVEFRTGGGSWLPAYTNWIDRRVNIVYGGGPTTQANVASNQARVSIVGLLPATAYDVKITWADPDGITGAASITNSVTTLSFAVITNGTERWVDSAEASEGNGSFATPYKTVTNAEANCVPGDTVVLKSGTYPRFTWTSNGTSSGQMVIRRAVGATVNIEGGNVADTVRISAHNVRVDGLNALLTTNDSFVATSGFTNIWFLNNSALVHTNNSADAFLASAGATNIYFLTNYAAGITPTIGESASSYGINIDANCESIVIGAHTNRYCRDGMGTGNGWTHGIVRNGDVFNSDFGNYYDDPVEFEGMFNNVRFWGNRIWSTNAQSLFGVSGLMIGPVYVFRNTFSMTNNRAGGLGLKHDHTISPGMLYVFHNTIDMLNMSIGSSHEAWSGGSNVFARNNIIMAKGNCIRAQVSPANFDHNVYTNSPGLYFSDPFYGSTRITFADHQATGQDLNSVFAYISFETDTYIPATGSASRDIGTILPNFNDEFSAWAFGGSAPDAGAVEHYPVATLYPGRLRTRAGF